MTLERLEQIIVGSAHTTDELREVLLLARRALKDQERENYCVKKLREMTDAKSPEPTVETPFKAWCHTHEQWVAFASMMRLAAVIDITLAEAGLGTSLQIMAFPSFNGGMPMDIPVRCTQLAVSTVKQMENEAASSGVRLLSRFTCKWDERYAKAADAFRPAVEEVPKAEPV